MEDFKPDEHFPFTEIIGGLDTAIGELGGALGRLRVTQNVRSVCAAREIHRTIEILKQKREYIRTARTRAAFPLTKTEEDCLRREYLD